jgi:two-component system sensor histidine kinase CpxA
MRTIYAKILTWFLLTLVVCLAGFVGTSVYLSRAFPRPGSPMARMNEFMLEQVLSIYKEKGSIAANKYLTAFNVKVQVEHLLVDSWGRDAITGEDRSSLLHHARTGGGRGFPFLRPSGEMVFATPPRDEGYRLLVVMPPPAGQFSDILPYYLWILGAVALLAYLLASRFIKPLQSLVATVDRFGRGDLAVRLGWKRRDEFGELGAAFDKMAERIDTLLTAERRLLQDVSHELRSPLARLNFAVDLGRTSSDRKAAMDRVQREADRLARLVDELLEVTQAEGDPATRNLEELRLDSFVQELADDCKVEAQARGCQLRLNLQRIPILHADRELLRRAVENVLRNGIRHAPEGSTIDVSVAQREGIASVAIRDHGTGVPEDMLPEIFKPFVRVGEDRSRDSGGVGLGLSIAQRAVALHDGRIWAENSRPGLRVCVELPVR